MTTALELPCAECGGECCKTNPLWDECQYPAGQTPPAILKFVDGACPLLAGGRCTVYGTEGQRVCKTWRCDTDSVFRKAHPRVDALLKERGL